ncbi:organic cation transporter protein-like [Argonauta hians]
MVSCVTAMVELFPKNRRLFMSGIFSFIWSSMSIVSVVRAYLISNYNWTALAISNCIVAGIFIVQIIFLEESIPWLFVHGKVERAKKVLQRAARQNKLDFDTIWTKHGMEELEVNNIEQENPSLGSNDAKDISSKGTEDTESVWIKLVDIFKMPYLRKITFIFIVIWIVDATTYTGLYFLSEALGENLYINFAVMTVGESLATLLYIFALTRYGHKVSIGFSKMYGGVCLVVAAVLKMIGEDNEAIRLVSLSLSLAAMLGVGAVYGGDYIYTPELYPTSLRSVGLGLVSSVCRFVSMGAPFLRILAVYYPWLPLMIMGTGCISTAILLWLTLPETKGKILPQTIEELVCMRLEEKERKVRAKRNRIKPI